MTHIMVDLETWGTVPGSDIRSIGAVVFDPLAGTLGDEFYVNVYQGSLFRLARDPSTVEWWEQQSEAAQQRLTIDVQPIQYGLAQFAEWWTARCPHAQTGEAPATFWAHGPHFDEAILGACFRATFQTVPWHYRAPRDCRTIWEAVGGVELPFEGVEHNALDDAKHQARCVIEAYRRIASWRAIGNDFQWVIAADLNLDNLTIAEANELDTLLFRKHADLPFGTTEQDRIDELATKSRAQA